MYQFTYVRPKTLSEAASFLAANPEAKLLSGGMTLIPTLKQRLARPSHLVDIGGLADLSGITEDNGVLAVGAMSRHMEVARSKLVAKVVPALAELADQIGDPQVRNLGTIGGSLANNDPAADYPAAVLGLGATIVTNRRKISADDYFQGLFSTALEDGEIVVRILFPRPSKAAYMKFPHPASGFAMTGVFLGEVGREKRVAVTGAGQGVFRWSTAEAGMSSGWNAGVFDSAKLAVAEMLEDIHGTREYRANLVRVMAKRALAKLA